MCVCVCVCDGKYMQKYTYMIAMKTPMTPGKQLYDEPIGSISFGFCCRI